MRVSCQVMAFSLFLIASMPGQAHRSCELTQLQATRPGQIYPYGINNAGTVVGISTHEGYGGWHATVWKKSSPLALKQLDMIIYSWATAINDSGTIVGHQEGQHYMPVIWEKSGVRKLDRPAYNSFVYGINNKGVAVGSSWPDNSEDRLRPIVWIEKKAYRLQAPPMGGDTGANGINDQGEIIGNTRRPDGSFPVKWVNWRPHFLHLEGNGYAHAINNKGMVVGSAGTADAYSAVVWHRGEKKYLPALHGSSTALAINNNGLIVGVSGDRAVLWDGSMVAYDLNSCLNASDVAQGWVLTSATGINDRGEIVGRMTNIYGMGPYAFRLKIKGR